MNETIVQYRKAPHEAAGLPEIMTAVVSGKNDDGSIALAVFYPGGIFHLLNVNYGDGPGQWSHRVIEPPKFAASVPPPERKEEDLNEEDLKRKLEQVLNTSKKEEAPEEP